MVVLVTDVAVADDSDVVEVNGVVVTGVVIEVA